MLQPSASSQYLLELINRARLNPSGEASLYDIDLNEGLNSGTISSKPKQPLAFNFLLNDAADSHSQWMIDNNQFSHIGAEGKRADDRITDVGYQYNTWGENLGYSGTTGTVNITNFTKSIHQNLFESSGHRQNLLKDNFREVGLATLIGDFAGFNSLVVTQNFATANSNPFLTGVAFDDGENNDDFYSIGEGLANVQIIAIRQSDDSSFSTSTMTTGGYQLELEPGIYDVTFVSNYQKSTSQVTIHNDNVKLDLNTEDLPSLSSDNILHGSAIDDLILGNDGNDTIFGGAGVDTLMGDRDHDLIYGGNGDDLIYSGTGHDTVEGEAGNDLIQGSWGNEVFYGGSESDSLFGNQNNDRLYGQVGDDFLHGGFGNDFLYAGSGNDTAVGDVGRDRIFGESGNDLLYGGDGSDTIDGGQDHDVINGGNGDDFIYPGSGHDTANGAAGNDLIVGSWGNEVLYGGSGSDTLEGNQNNDHLIGDGDNDLLDGGFGNDFLYAGSGNDTARGGVGRDRIFGEAGNDLIYGGEGSDTITGGQHNDIFTYSSANDSPTNQPDIITDFTTGADQLWLDLPNFSPTTIGSVSNLSQANAYFDGSSIKVAFSAAESILYIDADAQGIADIAIKLEAVTALNLSDFV